MSPELAAGVRAALLGSCSFLFVGSEAGIRCKVDSECNCDLSLGGVGSTLYGCARGVLPSAALPYPLPTLTASAGHSLAKPFLRVVSSGPRTVSGAWDREIYRRHTEALCLGPPRPSGPSGCS